MFVAIYIDHVLTSRQEQPPSFQLGPTPITPSVEKVGSNHLDGFERAKGGANSAPS